MDMKNFLIIVVVSYLLGSLNSSIIVSRLIMGVDVRKYGSGNAGLTNSFRTMGAKKTAIVLVGDILKGVIAVLIGLYFGGDLGKLIGGVCVMLGHIFPLYFRFKGGKGVLTGGAFLIMFDWRIFTIAMTVFLIGVFITKWISFGSIVGAISFPISMHIFYHNVLFTGIALCIGGAIIYMHRSNIGRIIRGEESKFSFKNKPQLLGEKEGKK